MRVEKTFTWQPASRRLTDSEVAKKIRTRFPQFVFNVESSGDTVTVTFLHELMTGDLQGLAQLLDEVNPNWREKFRQAKEADGELTFKERVRILANYLRLDES